MDMYQKGKIRAEKKNNQQNNEVEKIGINWYVRSYEKTLLNS